MASIVERIPQALQATFGSDSDEAARTCGFIKRERGFSGSEFVRTLVFGWLGRARASIETLAERLGISGSGLQQRLTEQASECLRLVFKRALEKLLASRQVRIPLLAKFSGVYVEDCTTISLPAAMADECRRRWPTSFAAAAGATASCSSRTRPRESSGSVGCLPV